MSDVKPQPRKDGLLPCLTPGCSNTPANLHVTTVLAQLNYQRDEDPNAVVRVECQKCRKTNVYNHATVIALVPEKLRARPLPEGLTYAIVLAEIDTAPTMPRGFFGERILCRVDAKGLGWRGRTLGPSQFLGRSLPEGCEVAGIIVSDLFIIEAKRVGNSDVPVVVKDVPRNTTFAIMLSPRNAPNVLMSANPFCPNPSCGNISTFTYSTYQQQLREAASMALGLDADAGIVWGCSLCQSTMIIGERTFSRLYKI